MQIQGPSPDFFFSPQYRKYSLVCSRCEQRWQEAQTHPALPCCARSVGRGACNTSGEHHLEPAKSNPGMQEYSQQYAVSQAKLQVVVTLVWKNTLWKTLGNSRASLYVKIQHRFYLPPHRRMINFFQSAQIKSHPVGCMKALYQDSMAINTMAFQRTQILHNNYMADTL